MPVLRNAKSLSDKIFHKYKFYKDKYLNRNKSLERTDGEIIKRYVKVLSIKDEKGDMSLQYKFEFNFVKEDNKKKAIVSINDEKVILEDGQSCIFTLRSGDFSFRLKTIPDFKKDGCNTIACMDSNIKDEDI